MTLMTEESNVVELSSAYEERLRRQHEEEPGSVFHLDLYEYNGLVGISEPKEGPGVLQGQVMAILDVKTKCGIIMDPADAESLGMALIQAAGSARVEALIEEKEENDT